MFHWEFGIPPGDELCGLVAKDLSGADDHDRKLRMNIMRENVFGEVSKIC